MLQPQHGQSSVEFGLAAVVLLLLALGLTDLGRVFYFDVGLAGAAREGARQAIWFDPKSGTNPFLYDSAIQAAVDGVLTNSGLPASILQHPSGTTCHATSDGNSVYNPPYTNDAYTVGGTKQPFTYIS